MEVNFLNYKITTKQGLNQFLELVIISTAILVPQPSEASLYSGLFLIVLGLSLKAWTFGYPKKRNRKFEIYGPFRFVRHPLLFSTLLICSGVLITTRNLVLIGLFFILFIIVFLVQSKSSDRLRSDYAGSDYAYYKKFVSSLVPAIVPFPSDSRKEFQFSRIIGVRLMPEVDVFISCILFCLYIFAFLNYSFIGNNHHFIAPLLTVTAHYRLISHCQFNKITLQKQWH